MDGGRRRPTHELVSLVGGETSRTRRLVNEVEGSGLGLAIAREMITRMGGVLDIVDEGPNRLNGTTVRVILFHDPET